MSNIKVDSIKGQEPTFEIECPNNLNILGGLSIVGPDSAIGIPKGKTDQRPSSPSAGMIRYNTSLNAMEVYNGTEWNQFAESVGTGAGGGGSGPYTGLDATSIEAFWDGASDQVSGNVWLSKNSHPNVSNANCTMNSGVTYNSSVPGGDGSIGYWSFNGSSGYGWINDLNYSNGGQHGPQNNGRLYNFTMGTWFRTDYGTPDSGGGWDSGNWSWLDWDRSEVISFNIGTAGKIQFSGYSNNGGYYDIHGNQTYNDGNWHFAVITVSADNNQIRFYGDGQPDGTQSHNFSYFGARTRRWGFIGDGSEAGSNNGSRNNIYYDGDIAQMFLFNEVWSDAQVLDHYTRTRTRFGV